MLYKRSNFVYDNFAFFIEANNFNITHALIHDFSNRDSFNLPIFNNGYFLIWRKRLSVELAHNFWPVDYNEMRIRFVCNSLRNERLSCSGRAVQQHPLRSLYPQPFEYF